MLTIGVDATNIRTGGGLTHLTELLDFVVLEQFRIKKIIIWSNSKTLKRLPNYPWLKKKKNKLIDLNPLLNFLWQLFHLNKELVYEKCDILFVLGGTYLGNFKPFVTMCRNLLPFDKNERKRYYLSKTYFRLQLLAIVQRVTYKNADGVIFLTEYSMKKVENQIGIIKGRKTIIHHGVNKLFFLKPKIKNRSFEKKSTKPIKILYVSTIKYYKNQDQVVKALKILREKNYNVELDLVGSAYPSALKYLKDVIYNLKLPASVIRYHGVVNYPELKEYYHNTDIFVFASTCETFGQILLEAMASGLPIACSNKSAMPEILGNSGVYFDPEDPDSIAQSVKQLIVFPSLRTEKAMLAHKYSKQFSWSRCADETFTFLKKVAIENLQ